MLRDAFKGDAYLVTVHKLDGDELKHTVLKSHGFKSDDLPVVLEALKDHFEPPRSIT